MAISFSEDSLSDEAKKALNGAKNKSDYVRRAVEFYVLNAGITQKDVLDELNSIKETLAKLPNLVSVGVENNAPKVVSNVLKESMPSSLNDVLPVEINLKTTQNEAVSQVDDNNKKELELMLLATFMPLMEDDD